MTERIVSSGTMNEEDKEEDQDQARVANFCSHRGLKASRVYGIIYLRRSRARFSANRVLRYIYSRQITDFAALRLAYTRYQLLKTTTASLKQAIEPQLSATYLLPDQIPPVLHRVSANIGIVALPTFHFSKHPTTPSYLEAFPTAESSIIYNDGHESCQPLAPGPLRE